MHEKFCIFCCVLNILFSSALSSLASVDYHDGTVNGYNFTDSSYDSDDFSYSNFSGVSAVGTTFSSLKVKRNYANSDFSSANLKEAIFSYADLANVDFSSANLYDAYFISAVLDGADFSGADVSKADFTNTTSNGFTAKQLYSTATYKQGNMQYMSFQSNVMTAWNFSGKDLTRADFSVASVVNADFRNAILTDSIFYYTDISGVDFRGSTGLSFGNCTTANTILADGSLSDGTLNLSGSDASLIIRPSAVSPVKMTSSGGVSDGASLVYTDISQTAENAKVSVSGSGVSLDLSQAKIAVYFAEDFEAADPAFITLAESSNGATIVASGLEKSDVSLFYCDGTPFDGLWELSASESLVGILVYIPEPSTWAIFPLFVSAFVFFRKKCLR